MDFKEQQRLCQKYAEWREEIRKKYLSYDPVDAFIAGYELGQKEKNEKNHIEETDQKSLV